MYYITIEQRLIIELCTPCRMYNNCASCHGCTTMCSLQSFSRSRGCIYVGVLMLLIVDRHVGQLVKTYFQ